MRTPRLLLLGAIALGALAGRAQDPFTVRVDVSLVTLEAVVTDTAGHPITTLAREDFEIYEDGVRRDIQSFASVESPYSMLMLFDCSGSTQPNWPFLVESMNRFTGRLRPQDSIAVAQFGGGFKMLLDWRSLRGGSIDREIQTTDGSCNGTDFYGAIVRALESMRATKGRKGAIVLTDGVHNGIPLQRSVSAGRAAARRVDADDDVEFQRVLRSVRASDVVFYFVAVNTDLNPEHSTGYNAANIYNMQQVRSRMEQLAEVSGGRVAFPINPQDVIPLYEQIGHDLGTSYGLGYAPASPKKDGAYHRIEVRLRDETLHVRQSRTGYEAK